MGIIERLEFKRFFGALFDVQFYMNNELHSERVIDYFRTKLTKGINLKDVYDFCEKKISKIDGEERNLLKEFGAYLICRNSDMEISGYKESKEIIELLKQCGPLTEIIEALDKYIESREKQIVDDYGIDVKIRLLVASIIKMRDNDFLNKIEQEFLETENKEYLKEFIKGYFNYILVDKEHLTIKHKEALRCDKNAHDFSKIIKYVEKTNDRDLAYILLKNGYILLDLDSIEKLTQILTNFEEESNLPNSKEQEEMRKYVNLFFYHFSKESSLIDLNSNEMMRTRRIVGIIIKSIIENANAESAYLFLKNCYSIINLKEELCLIKLILKSEDENLIQGLINLKGEMFENERFILSTLTTLQESSQEDKEVLTESTKYIRKMQERNQVLRLKSN